MIAFMPTRPSGQCPVCLRTPCIDGTACVGREQVAGQVIVASMPPAFVFPPEPFLPSHRNDTAPRSPRRSFKKSSKR